MFLKNPFEEQFNKIRNVERYTNQAIIDKCPDCGFDKLQTERVSYRGTGKPDRIGMYCPKCRISWFTNLI